jgi:hypothetical protein
LGDQQEQLALQVREALQAVADAVAAIEEAGAGSRSAVAAEQSGVDALGGHAGGLEPAMETLIADGGEAPARSLSSRAREVEEELQRLAEDARHFLQDELVASVEQMAAGVREHCDALGDAIAEAGAGMLDSAFAQWESRLDALEAHVAEQAFTASRSHARLVVEWARGECATACRDLVGSVEDAAAQSAVSLEQLGSTLERAGESLRDGAAELVRDLVRAGALADRARRGLDAMDRLLARYTFVGA